MSKKNNRTTTGKIKSFVFLLLFIAIIVFGAYLYFNPGSFQKAVSKVVPDSLFTVKNVSYNDTASTEALLSRIEELEGERDELQKTLSDQKLEGKALAWRNTKTLLIVIAILAFFGFVAWLIIKKIDFSSIKKKTIDPFAFEDFARKKLEEKGYGKLKPDGKCVLGPAYTVPLDRQKDLKGQPLISTFCAEEAFWNVEPRLWPDCACVLVTSVNNDHINRFGVWPNFNFLSRTYQDQLRFLQSIGFDIQKSDVITPFEAFGLKPKTWGSEVDEE